MIHSFLNHQRTLCDVSYSRCFEARIETVFRSLTDPTLIPDWLLAQGGTILKCDIELSVGGQFAFEWLDDEFVRLRVNGRYKEIKSPTFLHYTEYCYPPLFPAGNATTTHLLQPRGKRTKLTTRQQFHTARMSREALECLESQGIPAMHDALSQLLERIQQSRQLRAPKLRLLQS